MSETKINEVSIGDAGEKVSEASDRMALNVGPSIRLLIGVLRLMMELNGDLIEKCEPVLGYLHRGDEDRRKHDLQSVYSLHRST